MFLIKIIIQFWNPIRRRHILTISAPAAPAPPSVPPPGPGAYNIASPDEKKKSYMSSAVFVSCTSRWANEVNDENLPGPSM